MKNTRKRNKGFTLAEMLIVVAIIGILIAIMTAAINTSIEKAKEATDLANIRNGIAELMYAAELEDESKPYIRVFKKDGVAYCYCLYIKSVQKQSNWQSTNVEKNAKGYVKMGDIYLTGAYSLDSSKPYNTYQVKYYVDEQTTPIDAANPTPFHVRVVTITEASAGSYQFYSK